MSNSPHGHPMGEQIPTAGYAAGGFSTAITPQFFHVRGASTANISSLTAASNVIDGVTYANGERILLKDQSTGKNNGIYLWSQIASGVGVLTRTLDWASGDPIIPGSMIYIQEGTAGGKSFYYSSGVAPLVIGTDDPLLISAPAALSAKLTALFAAAGSNLTNADATIQPSGGYWRKLPAATLTAAHSLTLGTTNAVAGDIWTITRLDVTGFAYTIIDGGSGTPTLVVLPGGEPSFAKFQFDGTNWFLKELGEIVDDWVTGTALTDTATTTVQRGGRRTSFLLAGTMSQDETITIGTTGAQVGDIIRFLRTSTSAHTATFTNGGGGGGNVLVMPNSKVGFLEVRFDGTNWLYFGSSPN